MIKEKERREKARFHFAQYREQLPQDVDGRAVQIDPMKPKLKPPGAKRLETKA
jgi:hypothetical protein